jgi:hypothetical protein
VAFVDMTANARPYEFARDAADRLAPGFACGRDRPRAAGTASRWTSELVAADPR